MSEPKKWIKERYGAIAANAASACCSQSSCCDASSSPSERIGYTPDDLASVPTGADLGLGCGNPTALASIEPGETVLDLGSGAGFDAFLAAARVGPTGRVIGVDLTPEMIAKAQENAAAGGATNVEFRLGDIEALPVDDDSIDLVISNCVLNLIPDKPKAFREIVRVLKPGGRVAISDIVLECSLPKSLEANEGAYCSCISGAMGRTEYLAELTAAGLAYINIVSAVDAAPILASDCCGAGVSESDLAGVVTSISLVGRRPLSPSDSHPSGEPK